MRVVVQRVSEAEVRVDDEKLGSIGRGLLVFLGIGLKDNEKAADYLVEKIINLRIFPDEQGRLNRSLADLELALLVVSQFTLWGDCRKGRRPSFSTAADPEKAEHLYNYFITKAMELGIAVQTGRFQAMMDVRLINDGPVTLLLDSEKLF